MNTLPSGSAPGKRAATRVLVIAMTVSAAVGFAALVAFAQTAPRGPVGDYGDAPVGDVADNIQAYPGVLARWVSWFDHRNAVTAPVQHLHGTWLQTGATFRLGNIPPTASNDTQQNPAAAENDADPVFVLEALGPNPLAQLLVRVSTADNHDATQPFYLNAFVDQNRTGEWKDGWYLGGQVFAWDLEWVVQDAPIMMPPGEARELSFGYVRLAAPTESVWLRLTVSDAPIGTILKGGAPFWDATMIAGHGWSGEVEDHYLEYRTTYQPGKGIFPWWVYGRGSGGGGGGGNPKPACDAFYQGPRVVTTPWCPIRVGFNPIYRVSQRNDGCDPGLLWGMYGLKHLAGVMVPPLVALNNAAFFVPGTLGMGTLDCPDGTTLTLPAAVEGFGPMFQGHVTAATLRGGLVPQAFTACYPAPRRFRAYRAFLEVLTCGSAHQSVAVQTGPAAAHDPSVISMIGRRVDHVDFIAGDLIEAFIDLEDDRPFPDPDFIDYAITPILPGGEGHLDEETFVSPPASLRLDGAMYSIRPWMPLPDEGSPPRPRRTGVSLSYLALPSPDGLNTINLVSALGEVVTQLVPEGDGWTDLELTLPEDFELETIQIALQSGWIDDLVVMLAAIDDCNGNGVHDAFDIARGTSVDADGNGVPDECESATPCAGYCGTRARIGCWCDELCAEFGDCCDDVEASCAEPSGTSVGDGRGALPAVLAISNVAPNPFNPRTTIRFDLPHPGPAVVTVHDVRGRLVRTLWRGVRDAGSHRVEWDGRDDGGGPVPSGVYLVRVETADGSWQSVKVTLAK